MLYQVFTGVTAHECGVQAVGRGMRGNKGSTGRGRAYLVQRGRSPNVRSAHTDETSFRAPSDSSMSVLRGMGWGG
eukprot:5025633-Prymnesium_polylepis.3